MPHLVLGGQSYPVAAGQSVLEALGAAGVAIPSACGAGACQTCLMRALEGRVPAAAQAGLKPTQVENGHFLACVCRPEGDLVLARVDDPLARLAATVTGRSRLDPRTVRLRLRPARPLTYRAGQFLRLYGPGGSARCYSLASVPALDDELELHVRRVPGGEVSGWVHDALAPGAEVGISEATGSMFYLSERPDRGLCLVGTGCGLAPLWGIARDALHQGHSGPVVLFHGSHHADGLYLGDALHELARRHPNFRYQPCATTPGEAGTNGAGAADRIPAQCARGRVHEVAFAQLPELDGWSVYLCGHPDMVQAARRTAFLAGAAMHDIHADPFLPSGPRSA